MEAGDQILSNEDSATMMEGRNERWKLFINDPSDTRVFHLTAYTGTPRRGRLNATQSEKARLIHRSGDSHLWIPCRCGSDNNNRE